MVPIHTHITEVGRADKTFVDCGGTVREVHSCVLQTWVANDTDHRLSPGKLADILDRASGILHSDELPIEIESEDCSVAQFPVSGAEVLDGSLVFALATKHTECLAKDVRLPQADACCAGGGCC